MVMATVLGAASRKTLPANRSPSTAGANELASDETWPPRTCERGRGGGGGVEWGEVNGAK